MAVKNGCGKELTREENLYWRPLAVTSKARQRVRRQAESGRRSQKRKRTRRPREEIEEKHSGSTHNDTSFYENMYEFVN